MLPKNRKPTHPGKILFEEFLKPLCMSSQQLAALLGEGWTAKQIDALVREEEHFSEKWSERFSEVLGTTPQFWRHLQSVYHEWEAQQRQNQKGSLKPWKKAS